MAWAESTYRVQMFSRTVPGSLAATTPVVSQLAADSAWVGDDGTREVRHDY